MLQELIKLGLYNTLQEVKNSLLFPVISNRCLFAYNNCEEYNRFLNKFGINWNSLNDIPPIPVEMFKLFDLKCTNDIHKVFTSSATTGQFPSKIYLDKKTSSNQTKALINILSNFIGASRRPYIIIDSPNSISSLNAKNAAISGIMNFSIEHIFALDDNGNINYKLFDFINKYKNNFILFGFTFVIYKFIKECENKNIKLNLDNSVLLHSGGWKKLTSIAISKDNFNILVKDIICNKVLDFYGMIEQVGTIFIDCEFGYKHAPIFSDIIIRRAGSLEPCIGEPGLIEVLSILPESYPGNAIITEDVGQIEGIDDCKCGRKGYYFKFIKRVEKSEIRGCGDVSGY